jgi:hypothetical protein
VSEAELNMHGCRGLGTIVRMQTPSFCTLEECIMRHWLLEWSVFNRVSSSQLIQFTLVSKDCHLSRYGEKV